MPTIDPQTLTHPCLPAELYDGRGKHPYRAGKTVAERKCPECQGAMTYVHTTGSYKGKKAVRLVYAQCMTHADAKDHGYGPKSRHTDASYREGDSNAEAEQDSSPAPKPSAPASAPTGSLDGIIGGIIDAKVGERIAALESNTEGLDEKIRGIIIEAMAEMGSVTKTVEIKLDKRSITLEGVRHPVEDELVERYLLGERFFLLVGQAGTGKTTIARHFAKAIGAKRESIIACSEDIRREVFVGFQAFNVTEGTTKYVPSVIVEDMRVTDAPTVTILEEIDASNPNALLTLNALENGILPTPDCAEMPIHVRPPEHVVIATANTWGHAGSTQYVGRNQLDAATLDRYRSIFVDYDETLERAIVQNDAAVTMVRTVRERAEAASLRRVVSTRLMRRVAVDMKLSTNAKKTNEDILKATLKNSGWTPAEISRVTA